MVGVGGLGFSRVWLFDEEGIGIREDLFQVGLSFEIGRIVAFLVLSEEEEGGMM